LDSKSSKNNNEKSPYEILGVKEGAAFEDIQKARDIKVKEAGEDLILKAKIESSFDQLLMGSLKARQSGNVSYEAVSASKKEKQINQFTNNNFPLLSKIKNLNNNSNNSSQYSLPKITTPSFVNFSIKTILRKCQICWYFPKKKHLLYLALFQNAHMQMFFHIWVY